MNTKAARITPWLRLLAASVGPLIHVCGMPGSDLVLPLDQHASERARLNWVVPVLEVPAELGDPLECEIGIVVGVEFLIASLACHTVATSPFGSPARSGQRIFSRPRSSNRSFTLVNKRRQR